MVAGRPKVLRVLALVVLAMLLRVLVLAVLARARSVLVLGLLPRVRQVLALRLLARVRQVLAQGLRRPRRESPLAARPRLPVCRRRRSGRRCCWSWCAGFRTASGGPDHGCEALWAR